MPISEPHVSFHAPGDLDAVTQTPTLVLTTRLPQNHHPREGTRVPRYGCGRMDGLRNCDSSEPHSARIFQIVTFTLSALSRMMFRSRANRPVGVMVGAPTGIWLNAVIQHK
jgi:hypothetical protein